MFLTFDTELWKLLKLGQDFVSAFECSTLFSVVKLARNTSRQYLKSGTEN